MKNIKLNAITCTREEAAHKIADHLHHAEPFAVWFTAGVGRSYDADGNIICAYEAPAPSDATVLDLDELEAQPEATTTDTTPTNAKPVTVTMKRIDLCDLMLSCTINAQRLEAEGHTAKKWRRLHEQLKAALDSFDAGQGEGA